jgi:hypothetical protein
MAHYATLRTYRFDPHVDDIRGAPLAIEGAADRAQIDDVVIDHDSGEIEYFVAQYDYQRRVLLPLDRVAASNGDTFASNLSRNDLDRLPAFDSLVLDDDRQWHAFEELYRVALENGLPAAEMDQPSATAESNVTRIDRHSSKMALPRLELGPRWTNFAKRIRRDLHKIRKTCRTCQAREHDVA